MARQTNPHQRAYGQAVINRLAAETVPAGLKVPVKDFKEAQRDLEKATKATEESRAARDAALEGVATADATLDELVDTLANALVGAGLGTRRKPLASFTRRSVSDIVSLAYATEAKEVRAICRAIRKAKPDASVAKVIGQCEEQLAAVDRAIAAIAKPQASYAKALAKRDALFPEWTRRLTRLKRHAAVAWENEPALVKSTFAPPDALAAPKAKRRKVTGTPEPVTPAATE